ncbi:permease [Ruegeria pomeroyi]|uniref:Permease, putative n=2 Tax=Ruegeria pomeroyi TaxID=89184 RepID=Q5LMJ9_RUEPO|nr:permease [Ruegeria pomeroyi]HCE70527.1 permease [Ruegeria sp.]AAV96789.1 permease, putative [Ruegeria pomeroyi DSS-3]NVK96331.1 permease [Ruegeria pomeroyi]NVL00277.1 permease [Ruegeria pomeroyi]QWV10319.1 permease [Ruegeria pomeroyi]
MVEITSSPRRAPGRLTAWLKTPWTVAAGLLGAVALLDPAQLGAVARFAATALAGTAPYILFAVLLLAWLKATGAEVLVARAFEGRETRMILLAALFGGLAPFCSCEVIPFIAGLLALGAPLSAVMAFWLSSPLIDPPTLLITAGALGWPFAIGKAVAAVGLGLFGGFVVRALSAGGALSDPLRRAKSSCCGCGAPKPAAPHWRFWTEAERTRIFRAEFLSNGMFLLKWMTLAYVIEALLVTYVPAEVIAGLVGGEGVMPIVVAALVGMPAYLNSYVAPPLLAGLMEQGMTGGAAMAFMVAGAVSSIPAMAAVWSLVKPRVFALYLGLGLTGAVIAGMLFQTL